MEKMKDVYTVNVMTGTVITTRTTASIAEAAEKMSENSIGSLVVENENGDAAGIITESDIVNVVAEKESPAETMVQDSMSSPITTIAPSDEVEVAAETMADHDIKKLPVTNGDGEVVGIVTTTDLTKYIPYHREAFGD